MGTKPTKVKVLKSHAPACQKSQNLTSNIKINLLNKIDNICSEEMWH